MSRLTEYRDVAQGTDEWHDLRRGIVTASAVDALISVRAPGAIAYDCPECLAAPAEPCVGKRGGAIKTMHPDRSAFAASKADTVPPIVQPAFGDTASSLLLTLVAERITGWTDPTFMSDDMCRGVESEPIARELYGRHYAPVDEIGFMIREDKGWRLGYSPDGLVGDDGLIEIKSPRSKTHVKTIVSGEVPAHYMAQCQSGLLVSGRAWCDFVSYVGGMPLWHKRVYPDAQWHAAIVDAVTAFEQRAEQMTDSYFRAVEGLPATERTTDGIVI